MIHGANSSRVNVCKVIFLFLHWYYAYDVVRASR